MIAYSFRKVRPALIAASMKWMKWTGRSPVERAAALFPTRADAVVGGQQIAAQLCAVIGQPNFTG